MSEQNPGVSAPVETRGWSANEIAVATSHCLSDTPQGERVRRALCGWLQMHGLDPNDMPVENLVTRRLDERQVCAVFHERDDEGGLMLDGLEPKKVTRLVQLEAPPMPFPAEVLEPTA